MRGIYRKLMILSLAIMALVGCAGINAKLMPSNREIVRGLGNYNDIETLYNNIIPGKTTIADLKKMGLDPKTTPNVTTFNYLDVKNMFLTNPSEKLEDSPLEIQDCVKNKELCLGHAYGPYKDTNTDGQGQIITRVAKCEKIDLITGWELGFFLFRKGDLVVYKLPGKDMPKIHTIKKEKRPLCFLQEIDPQKFIPGP